MRTAATFVLAAVVLGTAAVLARQHIGSPKPLGRAPAHGARSVDERPFALARSQCGKDEGVATQQAVNPAFSPGGRPVHPGIQAEDLAAICTLLREASDHDSLERGYCDYLAPWIARNAHMAGKSLAQIDAAIPGGSLRVRAQIMATEDATSAYRWAQSLSSPGDRTVALANILYETSVLAPSESLALARNAALGNEEGNAIRRIALRWFDTDPDAALDWLAAQPDDPLKVSP